MAVAGVLGGCLKMETTIDIRSDDDIRVTMLVGIEKEAAAAMAEGDDVMTAETLCDQASSDGMMTDDVTVKDVSDGTYIACQMSGRTTADDMGESLLHADGTYTFTMASDDNDASSAVGSTMFDSFRVSVTFPGKVVEHSGSSTVKGTTVTWTDPADLYGPQGLRAVGKDTSSSSGTLWIVLTVVAVLVLLAIAAVVALLVMRKGKGAPVDAYYPRQPQAYPTDAAAQAAAAAYPTGLPEQARAAVADPAVPLQPPAAPDVPQPPLAQEPAVPGSVPPEPPSTAPPEQPLAPEQGPGQPPA